MTGRRLRPKFPTWRKKATFGDICLGTGWHPDRPCNELPPALDLEPRAILKQCVTARAALAEWKQAAELNPNPAMLINRFAVLEARASSEIEIIVTTADRLFRHLAAESGADPAA